MMLRSRGALTGAPPSHLPQPTSGKQAPDERRPRKATMVARAEASFEEPQLRSPSKRQSSVESSAGSLHEPSPSRDSPPPSLRARSSTGGLPLRRSSPATGGVMNTAEALRSGSTTPGAAASYEPVSSPSQSSGVNSSRDDSLAGLSPVKNEAARASPSLSQQQQQQQQVYRFPAAHAEYDDERDVQPARAQSTASSSIGTTSVTRSPTVASTTRGGSANESALMGAVVSGGGGISPRSGPASADEQSLNRWPKAWQQQIIGDMLSTPSTAQAVRGPAGATLLTSAQGSQRGSPETARRGDWADGTAPRPLPTRRGSGAGSNDGPAALPKANTTAQLTTATTARSSGSSGSPHNDRARSVVALDRLPLEQLAQQQQHLMRGRESHADYGVSPTGHGGTGSPYGSRSRSNSLGAAYTGASGNRGVGAAAAAGRDYPRSPTASVTSSTGTDTPTPRSILKLPGSRSRSRQDGRRISFAASAEAARADAETLEDNLENANDASVDSDVSRSSTEEDDHFNEPSLSYSDSIALTAAAAAPPQQQQRQWQRQHDTRDGRRSPEQSTTATTTDGGQKGASRSPTRPGRATAPPADEDELTIQESDHRRRQQQQQQQWASASPAARDPQQNSRLGDLTADSPARRRRSRSGSSDVSDSRSPNRSVSSDRPPEYIAPDEVRARSSDRPLTVRRRRRRSGSRDEESDAMTQPHSQPPPVQQRQPPQQQSAHREARPQQRWLDERRASGASADSPVRDDGGEDDEEYDPPTEATVSVTPQSLDEAGRPAIAHARHSHGHRHAATAKEAALALDSRESSYSSSSRDSSYSGSRRGSSDSGSGGAHLRASENALRQPVRRRSPSRDSSHDTRPPSCESSEARRTPRREDSREGTKVQQHQQPEPPLGLPPLPLPSQLHAHGNEYDAARSRSSDRYVVVESERPPLSPDESSTFLGDHSTAAATAATLGDLTVSALTSNEQSGQAVAASSASPSATDGPAAHRRRRGSSSHGSSHSSSAANGSLGRHRHHHRHRSLDEERQQQQQHDSRRESTDALSNGAPPARRSDNRAAHPLAAAGKRSRSSSRDSTHSSANSRTGRRAIQHDTLSPIGDMGNSLQSASDLAMQYVVVQDAEQQSAPAPAAAAAAAADPGSRVGAHHHRIRQYPHRRDATPAGEGVSVGPVAVPDAQPQRHRENRASRPDSRHGSVRSATADKAVQPTRRSRSNEAGTNAAPPHTHTHTHHHHGDGEQQRTSSRGSGSGSRKSSKHRSDSGSSDRRRHRSSESRSPNGSRSGRAVKSPSQRAHRVRRERKEAPMPASVVIAPLPHSYQKRELLLARQDAAGGGEESLWTRGVQEEEVQQQQSMHEQPALLAVERMQTVEDREARRQSQSPPHSRSSRSSSRHSQHRRHHHSRTPDDAHSAAPALEQKSQRVIQPPSSARSLDSDVASTEHGEAHRRSRHRRPDSLHGKRRLREGSQHRRRAHGDGDNDESAGGVSAEAHELALSTAPSQPSSRHHRDGPHSRRSSSHRRRGSSAPHGSEAGGVSAADFERAQAADGEHTSLSPPHPSSRGSTRHSSASSRKSAAPAAAAGTPEVAVTPASARSNTSTGSVMRRKLVVVQRRRKKGAPPSEKDAVTQMSLLPYNRISSLHGDSAQQPLQKLFDHVTPRSHPPSPSSASSRHASRRGSRHRHRHSHKQDEEADSAHGSPRRQERMQFRRTLSAASSRSASRRASRLPSALPSAREQWEEEIDSAERRPAMPAAPDPVAGPSAPVSPAAAAVEQIADGTHSATARQRNGALRSRKASRDAAPMDFAITTVTADPFATAVATPAAASAGPTATGETDGSKHRRKRSSSIAAKEDGGRRPGAVRRRVRRSQASEAPNAAAQRGGVEAGSDAAPAERHSSSSRHTRSSGQRHGGGVAAAPADENDPFYDGPAPLYGAFSSEAADLLPAGGQKSALTADPQGRALQERGPAGITAINIAAFPHLLPMPDGAVYGAVRLPLGSLDGGGDEESDEAARKRLATSAAAARQADAFRIALASVAADSGAGVPSAALAAVPVIRPRLEEEAAAGVGQRTGSVPLIDDLALRADSSEVVSRPHITSAAATATVKLPDGEPRARAAASPLSSFVRPARAESMAEMAQPLAVVAPAVRPGSQPRHHTPTYAPALRVDNIPVLSSEWQNTLRSPSANRRTGTSPRSSSGSPQQQQQQRRRRQQEEFLLGSASAGGSDAAAIIAPTPRHAERAAQRQRARESAYDVAAEYQGSAPALVALTAAQPTALLPLRRFDPSHFEEVYDAPPAAGEASNTSRGSYTSGDSYTSQSDANDSRSERTSDGHTPADGAPILVAVGHAERANPPRSPVDAAPRAVRRRDGSLSSRDSAADARAASLSPPRRRGSDASSADAPSARGDAAATATAAAEKKQKKKRQAQSRELRVLQRRNSSPPPPYELVQSPSVSRVLSNAAANNNEQLNNGRGRAAETEEGTGPTRARALGTTGEWVENNVRAPRASDGEKRRNNGKTPPDAAKKGTEKEDKIPTTDGQHRGRSARQRQQPRSPSSSDGGTSAESAASSLTSAARVADVDPLPPSRVYGAARRASRQRRRNSDDAESSPDGSDAEAGFAVFEPATEPLTRHRQRAASSSVSSRSSFASYPSVSPADSSVVDADVTRATESRKRSSTHRHVHAVDKAPPKAREMQKEKKAKKETEKKEKKSHHDPSTHKTRHDGSDKPRARDHREKDRTEKDAKRSTRHTRDSERQRSPSSDRDGDRQDGPLTLWRADAREEHSLLETSLEYQLQKIFRRRQALAARKEQARREKEEEEDNMTKRQQRASKGKQKNKGEAIESRGSRVDHHHHSRHHRQESRDAADRKPKKSERERKGTKESKHREKPSKASREKSRHREKDKRRKERQKTRKEHGAAPVSPPAAGLLSPPASSSFSAQKEPSAAAEPVRTASGGSYLRSYLRSSTPPLYPTSSAAASASSYTPRAYTSASPRYDEADPVASAYSTSRRPAGDDFDADRERRRESMEKIMRDIADSRRRRSGGADATFTATSASSYSRRAGAEESGSYTSRTDRWRDDGNSDSARAARYTVRPSTRWADYVRDAAGSSGAFDRTDEPLRWSNVPRDSAAAGLSHGSTYTSSYRRPAAYTDADAFGSSTTPSYTASHRARAAPPPPPPPPPSPPRAPTAAAAHSFADDIVSTPPQYASGAAERATAPSAGGLHDDAASTYERRAQRPPPPPPASAKKTQSSPESIEREYEVTDAKATRQFARELGGMVEGLRSYQGLA